LSAITPTLSATPAVTFAAITPLAPDFAAAAAISYFSSPPLSFSSSLSDTGTLPLRFRAALPPVQESPRPASWLSPDFASQAARIFSPAFYLLRA